MNYAGNVLISLCVYVSILLLIVNLNLIYWSVQKWGPFPFFSHLCRFKTITAERNVEATNLWLRDHSTQVEFVYAMDRFNSFKMAEIIFQQL